MINRRKGFTLAETLITITAIAVLAAITLPILNKAKIDKDTVVFRKGMYTIQRGLQKYMESSDYESAMQSVANPVESNFLANFTGTQICTGIANQLNTKGIINCGNSGSAENPNFKTTDGIKFWGITSIPAGDEIDIFIDRIETPSVGELNKRASMNNGQPTDGLRVKMNFRGKIHVPVEYTYEQSLIQDFTKMKN